MRFAFNTFEDVIGEAKRSAEVTHDHPERIKSAQATAAAIFLGRQGQSKSTIRKLIQEQFGYDLDRTIDSICPTYSFNESCQGTVPEAIISALDSTSYEDSIRLAISLGGVADTLACIAGGIAEANYGGVPKSIAENALSTLDDNLRRTVLQFSEVHGQNSLTGQ